MHSVRLGKAFHLCKVHLNTKIPAAVSTSETVLFSSRRSFQYTDFQQSITHISVHYGELTLSDFAINFFRLVIIKKRGIPSSLQRRWRKQNFTRSLGSSAIRHDDTYRLWSQFISWHMSLITSFYLALLQHPTQMCVHRWGPPLIQSIYVSN